MIALPVSRLGTAHLPAFRTGLAGEIAQKAVNYRLKLAVIGDISQCLVRQQRPPRLGAGGDRGREIWFEPSLDSLAARLDGRAGA